AHACEITFPRTTFSGMAERRMRRHGLRHIFDSANGMQPVAPPHGVARIAMRAGLAANMGLVPFEYAIEQAHRARMRDKLRKLVFLDHHALAVSAAAAATAPSRRACPLLRLVIETCT